MPLPTGSDYFEAIQNPQFCFERPELRGGRVVGDDYGVPKPITGNFAEVYEFIGANGRRWAVKCFTREIAQLHHRYSTTDAALKAARAEHDLSFLAGFEYVPHGIRVNGACHPVVLMDWVQGQLLNDFVRGQLHAPHRLKGLAEIWVRLAQNLRDAGIAHGDLQHGNVMLVTTPRTARVVLVDYDGMYVPALAGTPASECGHPSYQHRERAGDPFHAEADRFALLVICAAIRALAAGGQPLWDRYDNGDNLLFREADLKDPAGSALLRELWALSDPAARALAGWVVLASRMPQRAVPHLADIWAGGAPRLSAAQRVEVDRVLGARAPARAPRAATFEPKPPARTPAPAPVAGFVPAPTPPPAPKLQPKPKKGLKKPVKPVSPLAAVFALSGALLVAVVAGFITSRALNESKAERETATAPTQQKVSTNTPTPTPPPQPPDKKLPRNQQPPVTPKQPTPEPPKTRLQNVRFSAGEVTIKPGQTVTAEVAVARDGYSGAVALLQASPTTGLKVTLPGPTYADTIRIELTAAADLAPGTLTVRFRPEVAVSATGAPFDVSVKVAALTAPTGKGDVLVTSTGTVYHTAISADGTRAVAGGVGGQLLRVNLKTGAELPPLKGTIGLVQHMSASAEGTRAVVAFGQTLEVWDLSAGKVLHKLTFGARHVTALALSADGKRAVVGGLDGEIQVWDADAGKELARLTGHTKMIGGLALSADGTRALSCGHDKTLRVWDVPTRTELRQLPATQYVQTVAALSADGKRALTAGYTKLYVWDVPNGKELHRLEAHRGYVQGAAMTPDGKRAVSGALDKTVIAWDLDAGKELRRFDGHTDYLKSVGISADGTRAVSGGNDKTVRLWRLDD
jgi:predicted Ser/Thr protein kinase